MVYSYGDLNKWKIKFCMIYYLRLLIGVTFLYNINSDLICYFLELKILYEKNTQGVTASVYPVFTFL